MLLMIRNVFGVVSVFATGATILVVSWSMPATVQAAFAYLITWFLLLAGTRPIVELQRKRSRRRAPDSDADQLARLTGVPGLVWVALFAVTAITALVAGARWLLVT